MQLNDLPWPREKSLGTESSIWRVTVPSMPGAWEASGPYGYGHTAGLSCNDAHRPRRVRVVHSLQVLCDHRAHIHCWEVGASHASGAAIAPVAPASGERFLTRAAVEASTRTEHTLYHHAVTRLLSLENTLNGEARRRSRVCGGSDGRCRGSASVTRRLDGCLDLETESVWIRRLDGGRPPVPHLDRPHRT